MGTNAGRISESRSKDDRRRVVIMAILAGLAIYLPEALAIKFSWLDSEWFRLEVANLLRGAIVGLFVGLARGSVLWSIVGVAVGAVMGWLYVEVWYSVALNLNIIWDDRWGQNPLLCEWLPGYAMITHTGSPWPKWLQLILRVTLWHWFVWVGWWICWRPRLSVLQFVRTVLLSSVAIAIVCGVLWCVTPLPWFSGHKIVEPAWGRLPDAVWIAIYLTAFPLCSVVCALQFKYADAISRWIGYLIWETEGKTAVGDEEDFG